MHSQPLRDIEAWEIDACRDSFDKMGWDYESGDVILFHGQVIPDPIAPHEFKPNSGDPLERFPSVFPVIWAPA
ncbi:MAG: hypothetical protein V7709_12070 [Halioglobus sp.]